MVATRLMHAALNMVNPRVCDACNALLLNDESEICQLCLRVIRRICDVEYCNRCGESRGPHLLIGKRCPKCRQNPPGVQDFDGFVCVGAYDGPLRQLILNFKRRFTLDRNLGHLLAIKIGTSVFSDEIDGWVPVPSHWSRRLRRGFQPTQLLAESIVSNRGGQLTSVLRMRRIVPEFHRFRLTPAARRQAIRAAFFVPEFYSIAGKSLCLVDDVTTTGATLREATRTLKHAGASRVFVATIANTMEGSDRNQTPQIYQDIAT